MAMYTITYRYVIIFFKKKLAFHPKIPSNFIFEKYNFAKNRALRF